MSQETVQLGTNNSLHRFISAKQLVVKLQNSGVNFGKADPLRRIRYYVKLGLIPSPVRKLDPTVKYDKTKPPPVTSYYPLTSLKAILEVEENKKTGISALKQGSQEKKLNPVEDKVAVTEALDLSKQLEPLMAEPVSLTPAIVPTIEQQDLNYQYDKPFVVTAENSQDSFSNKLAAFLSGGIALAGIPATLVLALLLLNPVYFNETSKGITQFVVDKGVSILDIGGESNVTAVANKSFLEKAGDVLARTTAPFLKINVETEIAALLNATGGIITNNADADLGTGELTASNVIYDLLAGDNVTLTGDQIKTISASAGAAGIGSVTGTAGRITSTGGNNPVLNIANTYGGQTSISTLGTIGTGTWNGNELTDPFVSNTITASNYLPLIGGTLTGSLTLNDNDGASSDVNLILGDVDESGNIIFNNSGFTGTLTSAALGAGRVWTLPDETGTVCTTGSGCGAAGALFDVTDGVTTQTISALDTLTFSTSGNGVIPTVSAVDTVTFNLGDLTGDWTQTGAFDIILDNADSQLQILESAGDAFYGTIDVGDLFANRTYTFPDTAGTVCISGGTCDASSLGTFTASQFLRSDTSDNFTSGILTTDIGTTLNIDGTLDWGGATISEDLDMANNLITNIGAAGTDFTTGGGLDIGGTAVLSVNPTISPAIAASASVANISGTINKAASGSHTIFAGLQVNAPTIVDAGAALSTAASLYVSGSPTEAGNNHAFLVRTPFSADNFDFTGTLLDYSNSLNSAGNEEHPLVINVVSNCTACFNDADDSALDIQLLGASPVLDLNYATGLRVLVDDLFAGGFSTILANGVLIASTGSGNIGIIDGIDVSDVNITNAINLGTNTILSSGSFTIDLLNAATNSTLSITNSDGSFVANLDVEGHGAFGSNASIDTGRIINIIETLAGGGYGIFNQIINGGAAATGAFFSISNERLSDGTNVTGAHTLLAQNSGSTINNLIGYTSDILSSAGTGAITNVINFNTAPEFFFGAGVTNWYGVKVNTPLTAPTNSYPFWSDDTAGKNIFAGSVRIGSTVDPTVALDVTGTITTSSNLTVEGTVIGLNSDANANNILQFDAAAGGIASGDLYWGNDLLCKVSEIDCGLGGSSLWTDQTTYVEPSTIGANEFRIYDSGGLNIGGTSDPGTGNLSATGSLTAGGILNINSTSTSDIDGSLAIGDAGTAGQSLLIRSSGDATVSLNVGGGGGAFAGIELDGSGDLNITTSGTFGREIIIDPNSTFNTIIVGDLDITGTIIGFDNDTDVDNVLQFSASAGIASHDLYWGNDLLCDVSEVDCGGGGGGLWTDQTTYVEPSTIGANEFRIYDSGGLNIGAVGDPGTGNLSVSGTSNLIGDVTVSGNTIFTLGIGEKILISNTLITVAGGLLDIDAVAQISDLGVDGINLDFSIADDNFAETHRAFYLNVDDNSTTAADTTYGLYLDNENGVVGADALLVVDNSDTVHAVDVGIEFIDAGGGFTIGIDMANAIIANIGAAGTDFDTSGGLTLAADLTVNADAILSNTTPSITFTDTDGGDDDWIVLVDADDFIIRNTVASSTGDLEFQDSSSNVLATLNENGMLELVQNGHTTTGFGGVGNAGIVIGGTITKDAADESFYALSFTSQIDIDANPGAFGGDLTFRDVSKHLVNSDIGNIAGDNASFFSRPTIEVAGVDITNQTFTGPQSSYRGSYVTLESGTLSTELTVNDIRIFEAASSAIGSGTTVTDLSGLYVANSSGAGTLTNQYGVYIENLTSGGTIDYGIYIAGADSEALFVDAGTTRLDGLVSVGLSGTASTTAVCSSLANTTAPTGGIAYELRDCSGAPAADYMEMYSVEQDVEPGDLVNTSSNYIYTDTGDRLVKLGKTSSEYDNSVIGVVSNPEDAGDFNSIGYNIKENDNPMPVALAGRVQTKVSDENGSIAPGDPLTSSSTPGVAMKATKSGPIIGKALESFDDTGEGKILVFVSTSWYVETIGEGSQLAGIDNLSLNTLTANYIILGDNTITLDNVGNLLIDGDLVLAGDISADSIVIDKLFLSDESSGNKSIAAGQKSVTVTNSNINPDSKIIVTFNSDWAPASRYWVEKQNGKFIVKLDQPVDTKVDFDWIVIGTKNN